MKNHNEIVYSFILLLLSNNHYGLGCDLLTLVIILSPKLVITGDHMNEPR